MAPNNGVFLDLTSDSVSSSVVIELSLFVRPQ